MAIALVFITSTVSIGPAVFSEMFPTRMRAVGIGLPTSLAVAIFGGTTPYLQAFFADKGIPGVFNWYAIVLMAISVATVIFFLPESKGKDLTAAGEVSESLSPFQCLAHQIQSTDLPIAREDLAVPAEAAVTPNYQGPLSGTVVVDLTRALAGPHRAIMLGDLGARVVKVETPDGGDDTRRWGPPFVDPAQGERESTYLFLSANRNKESIALDLKSENGCRTLTALIARADVLIENFRTGVMDRLGFPMERLAEINPGLVVLSISGFGHDGPEGGRAGYDQIAQGEAGLMSLTGSSPDDPQRVGVPIADLLAGVHGAFGILAALRGGEVTGRGQVVRTSLLASVVGVHAFQGTRWTVAGEIGEASGNHHPSICPYGLFPTADGAVQIAVGSEGLWKRFCAGFWIDPDTHGMATNPERVENRKKVNELVEMVFGAYGTEEL